MANQDYIPRSEGKLLLWLKHLRNNFASRATPLGVEPSIITGVEAHCDSIIKAMKAAASAKNTAKAARATKQAAKKEGLPAIRKGIGNLKTRKGYNTSIGVGLNAIGARPEVDENKARPVLRLRKLGVGWEIRFGLRGFFSGIDIFRQRPGESGFTYIASDMSSPYIDTDPQVNGTRYRAVFRMGDDRVGQFSNAVEAAV